MENAMRIVFGFLKRLDFSLLQYSHVSETASRYIVDSLAAAACAALLSPGANRDSGGVTPASMYSSIPISSASPVTEYGHRPTAQACMNTEAFMCFFPAYCVPHQQQIFAVRYARTFL